MLSLIRFFEVLLRRVMTLSFEMGNPAGLGRGDWLLPFKALQRYMLERS